MKPITKEVFLESINKSIKNASELIEEAKLLRSKEHIARSYSLFHPTNRSLCQALAERTTVLK